VSPAKQLNFVGVVILVIFTGTAVLSLQTPSRDYLFPLAAYLQLLLQVSGFAIALPLLRLRRSGMGSNLLALLCLLLFFALVSVWWSPYPELTLRRTLMIMVTSMFVAILTLGDPTPIATFTGLSKGLALFGGAMSVVGLAVYLFGDVMVLEYGTVQTLRLGPITLSQRLYGISPFWRISSLLGNPNTLASWLLISLTLTAYHAANAPHRGRWAAWTLLQVLALLLTFSRAGILATVLSLAMLWYLSRSQGPASRGWRQIIWIAAAMALLGAGLAIFCVYGDGLTSIAGLYHPARLSLDLNLRELAWRPLWQTILERPLMGVGFGVSSEAVLLPEGVQIVAHNTFLAVASEVGILGLLTFLVLWFLPLFVGTRRLRHRTGTERTVLATCVAIATGLVIHQVFEGTILRYGFHTLFWMYLLALMVHPAVGVPNNEPMVCKGFAPNHGSSLRRGGDATGAPGQPA